uniref:Uncharacterized protein n=2 Tax=Chrysotila carterae TaxID=13221 RepID=A0A7S4BH53_CHRCT
MCVAKGVDFAVMPCCHRDLKTQGQMKIVAKYLGTSPHTAIDVARVGAITSGGFDCRWRSIPANITPENRILVGLAKHKLTSLAMRAECETNSDRKLSHIYAKIHGFQVDPYKDKASGPLLASSTARLLQQPVAVAE